jgi:hypothetical protein
LTRRCFFVSVIEHTSEQQDRCFRPRSTRDDYPGWERHEYDWMRAARDVPVKARPSPAVTGAMPRFLSSDERVARRYGSDQHATPLVIVQWGLRARRRSPTCHHYHCTIEGPSCSALSAKRNAHRRPEAPSVESSNLASGFDWWLAWILKRGSTRPTRECLLLLRMIANPTRRTTLQLEG